MTKNRNIHGAYLLEVRGRMIIVTAEASWNEECTRVFSSELKAIVETFSGERWGMFMDLRQWELMTPECWTLINELREWFFERDYSVEAILTKRVTQSGIVDKERVTTSLLKIKAFTDYDAALSWICDELDVLGIPYS
ncbi:hypothetical protein L4C34_17145 [Vibrio profundum]|uniref:hypothetical protein n=1 Tax=Vibrio profundum TaxID=2910247 RepID=UPI003D0A9ED2